MAAHGHHMIHLRICCFQFFQSSKAAKRDGCSFGADGTCCACAAEWPTDSSRLLSGCISTWPGGGAPGARGGSSVALHLFRLSLSLFFHSFCFVQQFNAHCRLVGRFEKNLKSAPIFFSEKFKLENPHSAAIHPANVQSCRMTTNFPMKFLGGKM